MQINLAGKRALVSGSTAGIGYAIAKGLAEAGAEVVINGRSQERVTSATNQLRNEVSGAKVQGVAADLGTAQGCRTFVEQVPETDILVNNLGIFEPGFDEQPDKKCT